MIQWRKQMTKSCMKKINICDALRDYVQFLQFKKVKNTHGEVLLLVKLQPEETVKMYKWYQIAQSIIYDGIFRLRSTKFIIDIRVCFSHQFVYSITISNIQGRLSIYRLFSLLTCFLVFFFCFGNSNKEHMFSKCQVTWFCLETLTYYHCTKRFAKF